MGIGGRYLVSRVHVGVKNYSSLVEFGRVYSGLVRLPVLRPELPGAFADGLIRAGVGGVRVTHSVYGVDGCACS